MPSCIFSKSSFSRRIILAASSLMVLLTLGGCDLSKNHFKIDRTGDREVQDYRDALAPRPVDEGGETVEGDSIPALKSYMATPSDKLKPMPLVSVNVNQTVPLRDVLYQAAEQAGYDLQLDPNIRGSIIFSARNRPFDEVIERISDTAGLRYKFDEDSVKIEIDTPYHKIYKINYLSYIRNNTSSISNNIAVVSGDGADTGSSFASEATSQADFWGELNTNLTQILSTPVGGMLRTARDPQITATTSSPAPVEPILLSADGSLASPDQATAGNATGTDGTAAATSQTSGQSATTGQTPPEATAGTAGTPGATPGVAPPTVQVQPPQTTLQIQPLAEETEDTSSASGANDPNAARYSINRQAGLISVYAPEKSHKQIVKYLDMLQKSVTAQVLIEAKVLEVSLTDEFAAGIDWSMDVLDGEVVKGFSVDSIGATSILPSFDPPSDPSLHLVTQLISGDLNALVQTMSRFGTINALASPRLTVLNNQSAVLNVAKNVVYFEIDTETVTSDGVTTTNYDSTIRNVPEGVLINVQPSIDLDTQTISMAVRPTVTRVLEYERDPASVGIASSVPVVNVQEFDSVISLVNGQAIVLGGLIQDRTTSSQNAVPVLGEIPFLGAAFRNQRDSIEKTELVVLLKATIVEGNNTVHGTDKDLYRAFSQDRRPLKF